MKTVLLLSCLVISLAATAQDSVSQAREAFLYGVFAYDFPNGHGCAIGGSISFHSNPGAKSENPKTEKFISGELVAYRYPFANTSISGNAGLGIRYIRSSRFFGELVFHQGLLRTIYDGKVYDVDASGSVKDIGLAGRTYLTSGFSYAFNWALISGQSNSWFIQLKPFTWVQYPYNSFFKIHVSLEAGINYRWRNHH